jgi:hypothetical protein
MTVVDQAAEDEPNSSSVESGTRAPWFDVRLRRCTVGQINLLKPTGYVMHQQFNIQQLYVLPTLYLCVVYLSAKKQRLVPLTP